jgi:prepilin-type N-terminal cleavage/methylation domain-containing protein
MKVPMQNFLKSKSGFTLIEVLIVGGILAGLALVTSQMTMNQFKAAKSSAAFIDRNSLQNTANTLFGNPANCSPMLQVGQVYNFTSGNPAVAKLADPVKVGVNFLTSNQATSGNSLFIQQMHLESQGPPVVSGANETRSASLVIPLQKMRTGNGVDFTTNTGGNANVGGDNLVPLTILLNIVEDSATHKLVSCSAYGSGASGCTAPGSTSVVTASGTACVVLACQPGFFNAGVYGKTDTSGHNKGDAVCCANGKHVAAIMGSTTGDDTPLCCGKQEYADSAGNCVPSGTVSAITPLCQPGFSELSIWSRADDGTSVCCHTFEIGAAANDVNLTCPVSEWMLNGAVGCGNPGDIFAYGRLDTSVGGAGRGAPGVWGPGGASGINGHCKSNNDTRGMITCCRGSSTGVRFY